MKTVTGRVISEEPISLSKAATILSGFVSSENEATQDVTAYLRRASAAFTELKNFHREIRSVKPKSEARHERNLTDELEEVSLAKGIDDLVESGDKIRSRESETVTLEESIRGREQDEAKEHKKKKKKKKRSKENKEEDVVDEKVNVKLEEEQSNGERKESKNEKKKKKKKSKKNKEEDVIDEKVNVKLEEEQRSEERKERKKEKKKRKSDGEICSEERKSKKMRKSKEIEG